MATQPRETAIYIPPTVVSPQPPPVYKFTKPEAPPPNYDSLPDRVREAKQTSVGCCGFFGSVLARMAGTIGYVVILIKAVAIPVAMIVIGSIYFHDCPVRPFIPIYLIVGGVFGAIHTIGSIRFRKFEDMKAKEKGVCYVFALFQIAWLIAGSVWVYSLQPSYNESSLDYCNRTLYLFSYGVITFTYCLLVVFICFGCCLGSCYACVE